MTMVMLAAYPDLFAAGAVLAGVAMAAPTAFPTRSSAWPGAAAAAATPRCCPQRAPRLAASRAVAALQVWQGSADTTVVPGNADSIVRQWAALHDLPAKPTASTKSPASAPRLAWADGHCDRRASVDHRMAHGVPSPRAARMRSARPAPHAGSGAELDRSDRGLLRDCRQRRSAGGEPSGRCSAQGRRRASSRGTEPAPEPRPRRPPTARRR
jgi:poly(3-hydroxybutyrate) depolymerase